ncbi:MAG: O-antigen ligase family protein [Marinobacter sp.]|nr:O-antigen ligase family protein [Marinobacter sp.]
MPEHEVVGEQVNGQQVGSSLNRVSQSTFAEKVKNRVPLLFAIWLFVTVLAPHQDLYKVFFHGILIPVLLILLFTRRTGINWRDPFLLVSLAFFAYASLSTFIVGSGPVDEHVRAFRWGVEITFGLLALYVWMPHVIRSPRWWALLFLWAALLGALSAVIIFVFYLDLKGRLWGLGALHNPIQAGSILLAYFAIGHFMLARVSSSFTRSEIILLGASITSVCMAVLLSESRAPIGAMALYLVYLGVLLLVKAPGIRGFLVVGAVLASIAGVVVLLYGGDSYLQQLLGRGMSYRLDIWRGYLEYPPASWWVGFGAGTPPDVLPAAEAYWIPKGVPVTHAHNLFIGTLAETGIIGLCFLVMMIGLVIRSVVKCRASMEEKVGLLAILGLVFMLTLTGSHTVVSSIKAVWLFLWIPVVFVWFWSVGGRESHSASNAG